MSAAEWAAPNIPEGQEVEIEYLKKSRAGYGPAAFRTCEGDLVLICNALVDYANIIDEYRERESLEGFQAASLAYYAERFRKIAAKYGKAIGYDRDAAIRRCEKARLKPTSANDFGEEAMALMVKRGAEEAQKKAQKGQERGA